MNKKSSNMTYKIIIVFCTIFIGILLPACAIKVEKDEIFFDSYNEYEFFGTYITEYDIIDGLDGVGANITLSEDNQFVFVYNIYSSYIGFGTYTIENNILTAKTDDGKYTYVFDILEDGSISLDVDRSADVTILKDNIKNFVTLDTDTIFRKKENETK